MKTTEKLEQVAYDLYYSMEREYNRAIALESVSQMLWSFSNNKLLSLETVNRLWKEINGGDDPLLVEWIAK